MQFSLRDYDVRMRILEEDVAAAEERVEEARKKLITYIQETSKEIRALIKGGADSGNKLHDECLVAFGYGEQENGVTSAILALDRQVVASKGKPCLIKFSWSELMVHRDPGPALESDYSECQAYIYGILSGERLQIRGDGEGFSDLEVVIPFQRFATRGLEDGRKYDGKPHKGSFTLQRLFKGPDSLDFVTRLGDNNARDEMIMIDVAHTQVPYGLAECLASPTEDETISGQGI